MLSNRLAFGALAIACLGSAAGGGYLATRQATVGTEAAAHENAGVTMSTPVTSAPVEAVTPQQDAVAASAPATAAMPEPGPQPAQRHEPVRRPEPVRNRAANSPAPQTPRETHVEARPGSPSDTAATAADTAVAPALAENRSATPEPVSVPDTLPSQPLGGADAADAVRFEELVVSADAVIGLELDRGVTSERARVEDDVEARVVRDVRVGRQVAIPAGARALGSVMVVERGGKFKERARLGIRFHTLVLGDGSRLPIQTDTIYRYGAERGDSSARKIGGGAVAGAILGAIIGGAKGAAVGATAGAGGGTAMVMAGERSAAEFQPGAEVTARILSPVTVTIER